MIELTAAQVAAATGGRLHADPDVKVTGTVIVDSRQAGPGALFVALPGERVDGHDFAAAAIESGAALVLAARELDGLPTVVVDDPRAALGELARYVLAKVRGGAGGSGVPKVVAVTGSVGKTTTKDLLGQLLTPEAGDSASVADDAIIVPKGSFNNEIGLPLTVLRVTAATRYLVLEMGADRVGNIAYLTRIAPPDVGVVLAVGVAHVGYFGSVEAIAKTKAEMVSGVVDGGSVVLNADDLRVAAMAGQVAPGTTVRTFGTIPSADVRAEDISVDGAGRASFTLRVARPGGKAGEQRADVALQLVGPHHVSNALAAATVALRLGVSVPDVAERLSAATARSPHRMAVTERPDGVTVIDDAYNANPDSMKAGLRTLAVMAGRTRRSVAVLGEMRELGDGARAAHDEIGRLVVRLNIKQLVVVGDGAYHIHEGAMQEGSWGSESIFVPDLDAARALLDESLEPGDVVLVKSSHDSGLWELGDHLSMVKTTEDNNK